MAQSDKPREIPGLHEQCVEVEDIELRVGIHPGKGRPILAFNGIGANYEVAKPLIMAMADFEVVIFDMPGVGGSEEPTRPRRFPGLAEMTAKLMDKLGYVQPLNVLGVSWGGALAQQYARQYPERVNRLVLAATSSGATALPPDPAALWSMLSPRRYLDPRYMAEMAPRIYGGRFRKRPRLGEGLSDRTRGPSWRGYIYQLLAGLGWTSLPWLHSLKMPTLIMYGEDDPIMQAFNSRLLGWLIPNARTYCVSEGGHLFLTARARESARVICEFFNERRGDGTDPEDYPLGKAA